MTSSSLEKAAYAAAIEEAGDRPLPAWAKTIRETGVRRFSETEFPHRKMEEWRFTNISPLLKTPFHSLTVPTKSGLTREALASYAFDDPNWTELVFVDGFYSSALSRRGALHPGVFAGSLAEALANADDTVEEHLNRYAGGNGNAFSALNTALLLDGAFLRIPRGVTVEHPIHLLFVTTARGESSVAHPRNLIIAEASSEATVIESHVGIAGDARIVGEVRYLSNVVTEVSVGDSARITHYKTVAESARGHHLAVAKVRQERSSMYTAFTVTIGGAIVRNELGVALAGEGAECSLNGLYLTDGEQLVDNATSIEHAAPQCTSWIGYRGVLEGVSKAVFSGRIKVQRGAQKTDSRQLNNTLLLSERATINTRPILEILADDVKCTHGATVSQPPEELIFYFQSRAIGKAAARAMLTYGFADDIIRRMNVAPLRERLDRHIFARYSPRRDETHDR